MIREERNAGFWVDVASHPMVVGAMHGDPAQIAQVIGLPHVLPLAAQHGGFLFVDHVGFGAQLGLHTLFTPEGWGREVDEAAKQAFQLVFSRGALVIDTYQMLDNSRSQPPRSFGFECAGDVTLPQGGARYWLMTKDRWEASPAHRRFLRRMH